MSIHKKILKIMNEIGPIEKDATNAEENFTYVSLASVIAKVRAAFIKNNVTIRPSKVVHITKQGDSVVIDMEYELCDVDSGEVIAINVPGER